jgi:hypothetical protein
MNTAGLDRWSATNPTSPIAKATKPTWAQPTRADLADGHVIAIDQSLANTGIVAMIHHESQLRVVGAESWKIDSDGAVGHEDSLRRAVLVAAMLGEFLDDYRGPEWVLRHELPIPLKPNPKIWRPESSLIAATAVRVIASERRIPVAEMMGAQTHKRITSGQANADKISHHAALEHLAAGLGVGGWELVTNEAKRDAASIALAHLYQEKTGA